MENVGGGEKTEAEFHLRFMIKIVMKVLPRLCCCFSFCGTRVNFAAEIGTVELRSSGFKSNRNQ